MLLTWSEGLSIARPVSRSNRACRACLARLLFLNVFNWNWCIQIVDMWKDNKLHQLVASMRIEFLSLSSQQIVSILFVFLDHRPFFYIDWYWHLFYYDIHSLICSRTCPTGHSTIYWIFYISEIFWSRITRKETTCYTLIIENQVLCWNTYWIIEYQKENDSVVQQINLLIPYISSILCPELSLFNSS